MKSSKNKRISLFYRIFSPKHSLLLCLLFVGIVNIQARNGNNLIDKNNVGNDIDYSACLTNSIEVSASPIDINAEDFAESKSENSVLSAASTEGIYSSYGYGTPQTNVETSGDGFIYGLVKNGATPLSEVGVQLTIKYISSDLPWVSVETTTDANGEFNFPDEFVYDGATYSISDYGAANGIAELKVQSWTAPGLEFETKTFTLSTQAAQFNFNSQISSPVINVIEPLETAITSSVETPVEFSAEIAIVLLDPSENVSLSSVVFELDGQRLSHTVSGDTYTANWTPRISDFANQGEHTVQITATASNGEITLEEITFTLECAGEGCPNLLPGLSLISLTSVNQPEGFEEISLEVSATDSDGLVQEVTLSIDGASPVRMTPMSNDTYTYLFTPSEHKLYNLVFTATDNEGYNATLNETLNITNSTFVSLPDKVNVGYYHSWESNLAPFIYLEEVIQTNYNVVVYSFIETINSDGFTPVLTINRTASSYLSSGAFDESKFIGDIKTLQDAGIPVLVSVGGQNGHVELRSIEERNIFVNGVVEILRKYGFDGLDIDFEGGSMNFGAGALRDFSYQSVSNYPKLKNVIDAIRMIRDQMGSGFHITAAPEVQYVQQGGTAFTDNWGSFLPVIHNIRDILDYIHVQLYNIGPSSGVIGLDGNSYYQSSPDLVVSATESLIAGFTTAGPKIPFEGLRPDQVAVGLPATNACNDFGAAGGGFVTPEEVTDALNYLVNGISFEGGYELQGGPYPDLRGAMNWSINWDKSTFCNSEEYEYANNIHSFFEFNGVSIPQITIQKPESDQISTSFTGSIDLEASVILSPDDDATTIDLVEFEIGDQIIQASLSEENNYTANWTPSANDFSKEHTLKVSAEASNGRTKEKRFSFNLECAGENCPNIAPIIALDFPAATNINQPDGFVAIDLIVSATDSDGNIESVRVSVDEGNSMEMTVGDDNTYSYEFVPSEAKNYRFVFEATDDDGESVSLTQTIAITAVNEISVIDDLLTEEEWNLTYFPKRNGYDPDTQTRTHDFYTYEAFKNAIREMSNYELLIERRCGTNLQRVTHTNLETEVSNIISTSEDFNASWHQDKPIVQERVSYNKFLTEGSLEDRKRELAAFFANISHETTGGPNTNNDYTWGLFFKEEGGGFSLPNDYVNDSDEYPPVEGKSYHGRGPIQLSYNYNYGSASANIYGDKNILLENPELVSEDGKVSFMTAIWFWMTPQAPKPSSHDVMVGNWTPTQVELEANRFPGLGMTVNIINGGAECNDGGEEKEHTADRIHYYDRYVNYLGITPDFYEGYSDCSTCGCAEMTNYSNLGFTEDCDAELPSVKISAPQDEALINNPLFTEVAITASYTTAGNTAENFKMTIDQDEFTQLSDSWIPKFFKNYSIFASVDINGIPYRDIVNVVVYDDENEIDCTHLPTAESGREHLQHSVFQFEGAIYKAKYWTDMSPGDTPEAWDLTGSCLNNEAPTLTINSSTSDNINFTISTSVSDASGIYFIELYVDGELSTTHNPRTSLTDIINNVEHNFFLSGGEKENYQVKVIAYDKHGLTASEEIEIESAITNCGIPAWYSDIAYLTPNSNIEYHVEHEGRIYKNNSYVEAGESEPSSNSKWDLLAESCDDLPSLPLADNCDAAKDYDPNIENYNQNDIVLYNGGLYRAKSWVSGTELPSRYGQYDFVGICVSKPEITTDFGISSSLFTFSEIEEIDVNALVNSFGFNPLTVQFHVKKISESDYTVYEMESSDELNFTIPWTAPQFGIYDTKITAQNRAGQTAEVSGRIQIFGNTPPSIRIISPENNSNFVQNSFEPITLVFDINSDESSIASIEFLDKISNITITASQQESNIYSWNWTPTTYGLNEIQVKAVNTEGSFEILDLTYKVKDPTQETLSFDDSDLYQIVANQGITKTFTFDKNINDVKMSNGSIANISFNGSSLTVQNGNAGRSGLKISTDDGIYYVGLRIDHQDGRVVGLPDYVSIGSVSEDVPVDLEFWEDIDHENLLTNKHMDIRYIYVNGGADTGWPVDNPERVVNYVKNSLRYGLIPAFIYYQLPDKNESYYINDISVRDPEYMTKYFENIHLFLDDVQAHIGEELFLVILEPDFLGYFQQVGEGPDRETAVGTGDEIQRGAGTLRNLVTRINREFDTRRREDNLNLQFGWQLNLWAKAGVASTRGIIRETDEGNFDEQLAKIRQTAVDISQYGMDVGILSHNPDFVSIDKYGLDAIGGPTPGFSDADPLTDPEKYTWFWNNDHWLNYLEFVKAMHEHTNKHIVLWQIPVGHINSSETISAYSGAKFPDLPNTTTRFEDSATSFFFGDEFTAQSDERYNYFTQNLHNDPKLSAVTDTRTITFGNHMAETLDAGVRIFLGGAGVGSSTDGVGNPPTDNYFWIQKVQEYYENGVVELDDSDNDGVNDFDDLCANTPEGEEIDENGCSESQKDDDRDGVNNDIDECPYTSEGELVNLSGCPDNINITINKPNTANLSIPYGSNVELEALLSLSYNDNTTTISSVSFTLDNTELGNSNEGSGSYTGIWTPSDSDYGNTHTFRVVAESSNGATEEEEFEFTLTCMGANCPNVDPVIAWNSPANTEIFQDQGFDTVPIQVTATDPDGTISSVTIEIDGTTYNMISRLNDTYTYDFTPESYREYSVLITATDNANGTITHSTSLTIANSQPLVPQIEINKPNTANLSIPYGSDVELEALLSLSYNDNTTTISSVRFTLDNTELGNSNEGSGSYTGIWTPSGSAYGNTHTFRVVAESSNGATEEEEFEFTLTCMGANCPNVDPVIAWNSPANTEILQDQGFDTVPIQVTATDSDGTISSVTIEIDGTTYNMISRLNDTYTYDFTPESYREYSVLITATDNANGTSTYSTSLTIANSQPLVPQIEINKPNTANLSISYGSNVELEALLSLSYNDNTTTISSVSFTLDNTELENSNEGNGSYTGIWTPSDSDYGNTHTFRVVAESSNGEMARETFNFTLTCMGVDCPNIDLQDQPRHTKRVVGYYAQWSIYNRNYNVFDIKGDKLTHLLYAFFDPVFDQGTQIASVESLDEYADYEHNESGKHAWDEPTKGNIGDLRLLKQRYPHLKVIISVGGWTRSQNFPAIAASQNGRETFAQSMVDFMNQYPWIDGFDIDWEFPITGGTDGNETINGARIPAQTHTSDDHKNFVYLLKAMRETFDSNNMAHKEVSISMGNNVSNAARQFIGPNNEADYGMSENIVDFCDFVSFFGYDFGGNWFDKTCYNAPLFGGDNINDPLHNPDGRNQVLSELVDVYLTDVGIPADKLVMGLPFYGKLFEGVASSGADPDNPGLYENAPRTNSSACNLPQPPQGTWDGTPCENSGSIEFCDLFQGIGMNVHQYLDSNNPLRVSDAATAAGWTRHWDDIAKVPYLYNASENKFISYDDPESIDFKVKYALSQQLSGVMIWELSQDARNSDNGLLDIVDNSLSNATYDIILNFEDENNSGLQGVTVELKDENGTVLETSTSDDDGQVIFDDKTAFLPYSIAYSYTGYSFLPSSMSFENLEFNSDKDIDILVSNQTSQISGSIKENGQLLTNLDVILKDENDQELERITTDDGNFTFNSVINTLNYSLSAEKDYYSFTRLTYTNLSSDQTNQEIDATRNTHTISGQVTSSGIGIDGVSVTLAGNNQNYTDVSDVDGNYSFMNVIAGYDYTLSPNSSGVVFKPVSTYLNLLNSDLTVNFQENLGLIFGTVKNGTTPISGAEITLILPWTSNTHPYRVIKKTTNSEGEYFYTESELDGYNSISKLSLLSGENNNVSYYPTDLENIEITTFPQKYNFNSQPPVLQIEINKPNTANLSIPYGSDVELEALLSLSYNDNTTIISSVSFTLDNTELENSSEGSGSYTGIWTPSDSDYGNTHTFRVVAESSNGEIEEEEFEFTLTCGENCPNADPVINWDSPANTEVIQNQGIEAVPIQITATDLDGTISSVTIEMDGTTYNMLPGLNDTYTYNFIPESYREYPVLITATDNASGTSTYSTSLTIANSQLPAPQIEINKPNTANLSIPYGSDVELEALLSLSYNDNSTIISSVSFSLDNTELENSSEGSGSYTGIWTPSDSDYGNTHTFRVVAESSNGATEEEEFEFTLTCGENCPNADPVINWDSPSNTEVIQNQGIEVVPIQITATDSDGTISSVTIEMDGTTYNMLPGLNDTYTYNFIPESYREYPVLITATDNASGTSTYSTSLTIANSQPLVPQIEINKPNTANLSIPYGSDVELEALLSLSYNDNSTTISSVSFSLDDTELENSSEGSGSYTGIWTPSDSDYGNTHTFRVVAKSSNGATEEEEFEFTLTCGENCPNADPVINWDSPSNTEVTQDQGLEAVPIQITATDSDGTISSVTIEMDGTTYNMLPGLNDTYTYNFIPESYREYPVLITATDNANGTSTYSTTLILDVTDIDALSEIIQLYPNPVTDILTIEAGNGVIISLITALDMLGQIVTQSNNTNYISLDHLNNGAYIIRIETKSQKILHKIIIKE